MGLFEMEEVSGVGVEFFWGWVVWIRFYISISFQF